MNSKEDKKISEALLKGTDEASELKNIVWNSIQKELNINEEKVINIKPRKNKILMFVKYGSIAAAVCIAIAVNTQYGNAAIDKIKQMFVPNKIVKQEIEGMGEESNVSLKKGSAKYVIYIDEERYKLESINGKDRITTKTKAENLPEVFMEIEQVKDKTPQALSSEIEKSLKQKYKKVENRGSVKEPINSILIYARSGEKWNDTIVKYYLIDNTEGGTFVVKQQFFMEASEGHGVRLDNMLKEFKIIKE